MSAVAAEHPGRDAMRVSIRRWLAPLALAVVLLVVGAIAGYLWSKSGTVALQSELSGTVSVVNATGGKFCVNPSGGGEERCGVAYRPFDAAPLTVGQSVHITVATVRQPDGSVVEAFIVEP